VKSLGYFRFRFLFGKLFASPHVDGTELIVIVISHSTYDDHNA